MPRFASSGNATFHPIGTDDEEKLATAFAGCDAVAHCAGIQSSIATPRPTNASTSEGTRNVVNAARRAGVKKIARSSVFCAPAPLCGSGYHESKFAAVEIVRASGIDFTVFKPGVIYGRGDHMLDHLSHAFHIVSHFALVGLREQLVRPLAVADFARIMSAAIVHDRLSRKPSRSPARRDDARRSRPARSSRSRQATVLCSAMPLWFHRAFGWVCERTMVIPLVSSAQVRILLGRRRRTTAGLPSSSRRFKAANTFQ